MKKKTIVSSLLTIVLCLSLIAGSTHALFTSEDDINIAVTSGKVALNASIENVQTWSLEDDKTVAGRNDGTFTNGGSAKVEDDGSLTIALMTPGDKVSFTIEGTNESTVSTQYRYIFKCVDGQELMKGLVVTIHGTEYKELLSYTSAWGILAAQEDMASVPITVELPANADNTFADLETKLLVTVEAVQGNANKTDAEEIKFLPATWDGTADTTWYDASVSTFTLSNAEQLAGLSVLAAQGKNFSGKTVILDTDVDFAGEAWTPIKQFAGTFDGKNHEVSNFTLDGTSGRAGFFQNLGQYPATVKNLTLSKVEGLASSNQYFGILAANGHTSVLENIHVVDCKIETANKDAWVGGIYGYFNWTSASNCTVENLVIDATDGGKFIGGFSGNMDQDLSIDNVDIKGLKITVTDTDGDCAVGGFTGQTQTGHRQPTFTNCDVTGLDIVVSGTIDVGGFIGDAGAHTIANNCTTEGKIDASGVTSTSANIGGFLSDSGWNNNESSKGGHKISNCTADVDIVTGGAKAGGFIASTTAYHADGGNRNMPLTLTNCSATGTVTVVAGATATIGGFAGEAERGTFKNCSTTSNTFIGKVWDGYTLTDDGNGTLTVTKQ